MVGPTPSTAASSSVVAAAIASIERNRRASAVSRGRPDVADREADEQPPERSVAGRLDAAQDLVDLLLGEAAQAGEGVGGQRHDVAHVAEPARVEQRDRGLVAQPVDVERAATGEVEHRLAQLGRAGHRVGAAGVGLALRTHEVGAALGAPGRHGELVLGAVAQVGDRGQHLGNHVTGPADHDDVADQHALAAHLVLVVQRRAGDRDAADVHRLEHRERRHPPGPADVDRDVEQPGVGLLRRVLERDRPPRRLGGRPEPALEPEVVDLDDDAVDLVLDVVPLLAPPGEVARTPSRSSNVS
jgi:hypothetical protein